MASRVQTKASDLHEPQLVDLPAGLLGDLEVWSLNMRQWYKVQKVEMNPPLVPDAEVVFVRVYFEVPGVGLSRKRVHWGSKNLRCTPTDEEMLQECREEPESEDSYSSGEEGLGAAEVEEDVEIDPGVGRHEVHLFQESNPFGLPPPQRHHGQTLLPRRPSQQDQWVTKYGAHHQEQAWQAQQQQGVRGAPARRRSSVARAWSSVKAMFGGRAPQILPR